MNKEEDIGVQMSTYINPVALTIMDRAFTNVVRQMGVSLKTTGYSPNIKEREDCTCALFNSEGLILAQAEHLPGHIGMFPGLMKVVLQHYPSDAWKPGDIVICNDAYHGGSHIPDVNTISPVFYEGHLVAFSVTKAHHADFGGKTPGSMPGDATEVFQEGLRLPPVKLYEGGKLNEGVWKIIALNVRTPEERQGDLRAQVAANRMGERGFLELMGKYGKDVVFQYMKEVMDYSERMTRTEIRKLPQGTYSAEDFLDDDGVGGLPIKICVNVQIEEESVTIDFTGTDTARRSSINAGIVGAQTGTYFSMRCILDPHGLIPPNDGFYRCMRLVVPLGTVLNPIPPTACTGIAEVCQRVTDVILKALVQVVPERVPAACCSTMTNTMFGGLDPRASSPRLYTYYETVGGGYGARPIKDGVDGIQTHGTNTKNTPIEALEIVYPMRVMYYGFVPDSEGAGRYRGGLGIRREMLVVDHTATFSELADRHVIPPWGLKGGLDSSCGKVVAVPADGKDEKLPSKGSRQLKPGTLVRIVTPGGGGYGSPLEREPEKVLRDVIFGKISLDRARSVYGVIIRKDERGNMNVDYPESNRLRNELCFNHKAKITHA